MKALHFFHHGPLNNLTFGDLDEPQCGPNEVVIRVRACALNHLDLWVLKGWPGLKLTMPHVGGADIAGEIHAIGKSVTGLSEGDKVIVNPGVNISEDEWTRRGEDSLSPGYKILGEGLRGGFAQFVAVPARNILPMPENRSFAQAAAPLLVGLTAWRMLKHRAALKAGETVLVVGAGGGVNSISIQLAASFGASVIALGGSDEKCSRATELGAMHTLNYKKHPDWSREVRRLTDNRGVDVVVDNVGSQTFPQSLNSACRGGRIVTVGNTSGPNVSFDNRLMFSKQLSLLGSTMGSGQDFRDMLAYLASHNIQIAIDRELPLKDGRAAYQMMEQGTQFGKIVLLP